MKLFNRIIFCIAMVIMGVVSVWTTYQSLHDSILPKPVLTIQLTNSITWDCSVFAMALALSIGLMLYALKMAIIEEEKRLNLFGILGLTIVGFISIAFNLDVLYRTANRDFFINYSTSRVKTTYEDYLSQTQKTLTDKRQEIQKVVAKQEGELEAEVKGLRKAPAGYGNVAKSEDYQLTVLAKTSAVELETIDAALGKKQEADALLSSSMPASLDEVEKLQHELRVLVKDVGSVSGRPLPAPVKLESPLFAVFRKLFTWDGVGIEEIFFVILAFFLDLGDIIGYSLVPSNKKKHAKHPSDMPDFLKRPEPEMPTVLATLPAQPEYIPIPEPVIEQPAPEPEPHLGMDQPINAAAPDGEPMPELGLPRSRRPISFRRR